MKKNLIVMLGLMLSFTSPIWAQKAPVSKIKFGVKAGVNFMTLGKLHLNGQEYDYTYKAGFTGGVFSEINLCNKFKLVPDINYSQKGGDVDAVYSVGSTEVPITSKTRVNYIDVPVALSYRVIPKLTVFAGPQVSFFLHQETTIYALGNKSTKDVASDKIVPGGLLGLGFEFMPRLNINARYMRDLIKGTKDNDPDYKDLRNSGFAVALGYTF